MRGIAGITAYRAEAPAWLRGDDLATRPRLYASRARGSPYPGAPLGLARPEWRAHRSMPARAWLEQGRPFCEVFAQRLFSSSGKPWSIRCPSVIEPSSVMCGKERRGSGPSTLPSSCFSPKTGLCVLEAVARTAAVTTTAAAVAAAAVATATAATLFAGAGLVHRQGTALQFLAVHAANRGLRLGGVRHLDEAEASGTARVAVRGNARRRNGAKASECTFELALGRVEAQVTNVNVQFNLSLN